MINVHILPCNTYVLHKALVFKHMTYNVYIINVFIFVMIDFTNIIDVAINIWEIK